MKKSNGNLSLAYFARQLEKHALRADDQRESGSVVRASLRDLWNLRFHPNYQSYPDDESRTLSGLLQLNPQLMDVDQTRFSFGFPQSERKLYRDLAMCAEYNGIACEPLIIPDISDKCKKGLLVETTLETMKKISERNLILPDLDEKLLQKIKTNTLSRYGLNLEVSVDELRKMYLDKHAYAMFMIGFSFPHLGKDSKAEIVVREVLED